MVEKRGKGVIRLLGLGLLLALLVLAPSGQSSASVLVQTGEASIDLTKVAVNVTGGFVTDFFASFPDVSDPGYGYNTSVAVNNASTLSASAEAGVVNGYSFTGLYVGSASASRQVDFTATTAGTFTLSILSGGFLTSKSVTPGPYAYSASSSAWLEIWNTTDSLTNPEPTRISLVADGPLSVSQLFAAGDSGYYKIEVLADASAQAVPEPSTTLLIGIGLGVVAFARKKMTARN